MPDQSSSGTHDWRADVRTRLASANLHSQDEADLVEEVAQHLEDQFAELSIEIGAVAAREQLLAELRDEQFNHAIDCRRQRTIPTRSRTWDSSSLWRDVRYGLRSLFRNPGTLVAGTTALALGIGLTTMMFSIIYGMLIKGLPFEGADRIASIYYLDPEQPEDGTLPLSDFTQFRAQQKSFETLAAYHPGVVTVGTDAGAERVGAVTTTAGLFEISGVRAFLGRTLNVADNEPNAPPAAVIGFALWRDRYSSDSTVIGKIVRVNGVQHTIVGVMPDGFVFPNANKIWLPLQESAATLNSGEGPELLVIGKIKPNVGYSRALAEFSTLSKHNRAALTAGTRLRTKGTEWQASVKPFIQAYIAPRIYSLLYAMLGAVFLVLLVACANVTNLLLNRAANRTRETAIRTALGASRLAVIRQSIIESSILATFAALLGSGIAQGGIVAFNRALVDTDTPFWMDIRLHPPVLVFVLLVAALASVVSGILPALQTSRLDVNAFLKDDSHTASSLRAGRMSRVIVVAEIAVSSALLVAAGFMTKSVIKLANINTGFSAVGVYTARVNVESSDSSTQQHFFEAVERALGSIPNNAGVYVGSALPGIGWSANQVAVEGRTYATPQDRRFARTLAVSAGFFETFGVGMLSGRAINSTDRMGTLRVAVVGDTYARRNFPNSDALGQRIRIGEAGHEGEWLTIVGVMPTLFSQSFQNPYPPEVVTAFFQQPRVTSASVAVRGGGELANVAAIRRLVASIDRDAPVYDTYSMQGALDQSTWAPRVFGTMFIIFGIISLILASIGLYAVMAFSVSRRTREMGVRMALGASAGNVIALVFRQGAFQIIGGMAIGVVIGTIAIRGARQVLFDVQPSDPSVF
ncbi:MAG: ABC transporter permease, partial [Gemmatimonadaceae bacterium]